MSAVQIRIFLGFLQNKELKMHLNQSAAWKEDKMLGALKLTEAQEKDKEYIGFYLRSLMTCRQLKEKEQEIKSQLQFYCPKLNLDKHHSYLFSQLFIS